MDGDSTVVHFQTHNNRHTLTGETVHQFEDQFNIF